MSNDNDYFDLLAKMASDLSRKTSQLDEMMQALYNVNLSIQDRDQLKKLINHMAKFNKPQPNTTSPSNKPASKPGNNSASKPGNIPVSKPGNIPASKPSNNPSSNPTIPTAAPSNNQQKGDFMYDLFNSPAMMSIIKEHYNKKKKK